MDFTDERPEGEGVTRRQFELTVLGERVPGVIWAPADAAGPRPLILMGHGGSQHKKIGTLAARSRAWVRRNGWASLAIDAPGHGDRVSRQQAEAFALEVGARVRGETTATWTPDSLRAMAQRTRQAIPEWKAALDFAQALPFVGAGKVGYWGVSMGTAIGVPFVAEEARITAAVFGLAGLRDEAAEMREAAAAIRIPVQFVFQWEDAVAPRETGLALFDAFGSSEKTMHINPGGHMGIPDFEGAAWEAFFQRHLA